MLFLPEAAVMEFKLEKMCGRTRKLRAFPSIFRCLPDILLLFDCGCSRLDVLLMQFKEIQESISESDFNFPNAGQQHEFEHKMSFLYLLSFFNHAQKSLSRVC